jgi:hypothetical protein
MKSVAGSQVKPLAVFRQVGRRLPSRSQRLAVVEALTWANQGWFVKEGGSGGLLISAGQSDVTEYC